MKYVKMFLLLCLLAVSPSLSAEEKVFTIIHTNDMHSQILGFSPNIDYTPSLTGDGTIGGWARVSAVIRDEKKARTNPVLVLDAGDFLMGSLFHMVCREESIELRLMKEMGYDAVCLGNHEFDLMPKGLARILTSASVKGGLPMVLFASAVFTTDDPRDETLKKVFQKGLVKPYTVMVRNGVKIGLFAIIGKDAAEVAPFAKPVKFREPIETAREMVKLLREKEKVDMVICISHSGLSLWGPGEKPFSEDENLAKKVDGIDIIVSGHTHTDLPKPIVIKNTIIVQAYEHGKRVGVLDFSFDGKTVKLKNYRYVVINDTIRADSRIQNWVDNFETIIDRQVLRPVGLSFRQIIAQTAVDMKTAEDESSLGDMIADSIRWYVNKYDSDPKDPTTKVDVAVESHGVIRDDLLKGKTGRVAVCDLFRAVPLGIGMDDTMSYPLITFYVNAAEIKKTLEVLTSIYPVKGNDYFLEVSGLRFSYNPRRVMFDRVTDIWLGSEEEGYKPLDYSPSNKKLYRVAANIYNSTFLKIVGNFTWHILDIIPKDKKGNPVTDLVTLRVDADKTRPGVQELKEWIGLMEYVKTFPDTDGDGIANIPAKYKTKLGRIIREPSFNPVSLLWRGTYVTWIGFCLFLIVLGLAGAGTFFIVKKIRKKRA